MKYLLLTLVLLGCTRSVPVANIAPSPSDAVALAADSTAVDAADAPSAVTP